MDSIDPAKKQYWIFSAIVSVILSLIINFAIFPLFKNSIIYGFPFNFGTSEGIALFFIKIIDSLILGAILTPGVYYFLQWLQHRR